MVASAASDVRFEADAVFKATQSKSRRGVGWIIAAVCIAAWSADAVLAWTATQVLAPFTVQASDADTSSEPFSLSRWRSIALESQAKPGTRITGSLARTDGGARTAFTLTANKNGKATTVLPAPQSGGTYILQVHAIGTDNSARIAVHQGKPHAHTAWLFYGFNAAAMLIFIAWRGYERIRESRTRLL